MLAEPFQFGLVFGNSAAARVVRWFVAAGQGGSSGRLHCSAVVWMSGLEQENRVQSILAADFEDLHNSQKGDSEAYRRLIERHQPAIGKLMWRFTRDRTEHEELVQQVFVEAWLSLAGFSRKAPFAHWLARIATRVGYRYWRQRRCRKAVSLHDDEWELLGRPTEKTLDSEQAAALAHRLLGQLPPRDRLVLTLRYLEQCDVAQTAYRTGWSTVRVRVQTHRAIAKLKTLSRHIQCEIDG